MINMEFKAKEETKKIIKFIKDYYQDNNLGGAVIGISGGKDSAVVLALLVKALGKENVYGIMMPYKSSSKESVEHAELVIDKTGMNGKKVEITPMIDGYFNVEGEASNLRRGNMMARTRMCVLFDNSAKEEALVLGTSNKTEILLGYSTQFGDSACAINPIGDLFKTQIWELSRRMGVPNEIIDKKPSADLWEGQTDEADLGFSYEMADEILYQIVVENKNREELINLGYAEKIIDKIFGRISRNEYKRRMPEIVKIF